MVGRCWRWNVSQAYVVPSFFQNNSSQQVLDGCFCNAEKWSGDGTLKTCDFDFDYASSCLQADTLVASKEANRPQRENMVCIIYLTSFQFHVALGRAFVCIRMTFVFLLYLAPPPNIYVYIYIFFFLSLILKMHNAKNTKNTSIAVWIAHGSIGPW